MRCFCFWHFFLPDKLLFLTQYGTSFDFRHDSLTIYDGGSNTSPMLENPYCGDSLPPSQISSSNELFFHFQSDEGFTGTGFKLEYNATSKNLYKVDFLKQCRKIQQPFFSVLLYQKYPSYGHVIKHNYEITSAGQQKQLSWSYNLKKFLTQETVMYSIKISIKSHEV